MRGFGYVLFAWEGDRFLRLLKRLRLLRVLKVLRALKVRQMCL